MSSRLGGSDEPHRHGRRLVSAQVAVRAAETVGGHGPDNLAGGVRRLAERHDLAAFGRLHGERGQGHDGARRARYGNSITSFTYALQFY